MYVIVQLLQLVDVAPPAFTVHSRSGFMPHTSRLTHDKPNSSTSTDAYTTPMLNTSGMSYSTVYIPGTAVCCVPRACFIVL